jgi:heavy metal sensor kinase
MTPPSIRVRLTVWYGVALTIMMIVYATATYFAVRHEFLEQLEDQLHDDFEGAEGALARGVDDRIVWTGEQHHDSDPAERRVSEVWSVAGKQLHRSGAGASLPPIPIGSLASADRYETLTAGGVRWRSLAAPVSVILRVSRSEERVRQQLWEVLVVLVLGLPVVVVVAGFGGYLLARRALAPIDHLASEARRLTADRLHERLTSLNSHDEIGRLTAVFNDTFARLESSFDRLRRFTADASHELRTPLAVIRSIGESTVAQRRGSEEYQDAIGSMLEETDRMTRLVETLLRLSHADAGSIRLDRERLDLSDLAREVAGSLSILGEERNQRVVIDAPDALVVSVDRLILREAVTNILDNALKYSPVGATVTVRVRRTESEASIAISDEGPGIPAADRERIFDRFFRVDQARSRDGGGAGLGLAIAEWAVEMHAGQITVRDRPGGGSEFQIVLPLGGQDRTPSNSS